MTDYNIELINDNWEGAPTDYTECVEWDGTDPLADLMEWGE